MQAITRSTSFFGNWIAEVMRQPVLMLVLVLGPFLVLLAFGFGVEIGGARPRILVVQQGAEGQPIQPLPEELGEHVRIVGETTDLAYARRQLEDGKVDGVAILPADPEATIRTGERVPIQILTSEVDPVRNSYARAYLADQVATLNQRTIAEAITGIQDTAQDARGHVQRAQDLLGTARQAVAAGEDARATLDELTGLVTPLRDGARTLGRAVDGVSFVLPGFGFGTDDARSIQQRMEALADQIEELDAGLQDETLPTEAELAAMEADLTEIQTVIDDVVAIPPETLSAPFELSIENVGAFVPSFAGFYAPAVVVLLVQHLAITLGALSMTRLRLLGLMDLLKTAPVRAGEVVVGNFLSYGALCALSAALLVVLVVLSFDVPVRGGWWWVVLSLVLLTIAGLGVGFVISLLSSTEQQAAQAAMLILLASIFFSGFVFTLDRISWPVRAVSYALPSTYSIRSLQDVMLRTGPRHPEDTLVLGVIALAAFVATYLLFRREFRPR